MKNIKRMIACIMEIAIGVTLTVCGALGMVDSYWSGMGTALVVVGGLLLLRHIRYRTDKSYKESVDVETGDERNKFLAMKAWSWAGYLFVMICAIASIVLRILGQDMYSVIAGYCVCLIIVLYWASYMILRRKY